MSKKTNVKMQMNELINKRLAIGESRHKAKMKYILEQKDKNEKVSTFKTDKIYSIKTAETYRDVVKTFSQWLKEHKKTIWDSKDLNCITKDTLSEYLLYKQDNDYSAWTISRDMAGLNKLFSFDLRKKDIGLKKRRKKDIFRSRLNRNSKLSPELMEKNKDQILMAKALGNRRESVTRMKPSDFIFENGLPVKAHIRGEKGGRDRVAMILEKYQEQIAEMLKGKDMNKPLFDSYSKQIDNHSFRAEYCKDAYIELEKKALNSGKKLKKDYGKYDKDILNEITKSLGHKRIDVCVDSYLDKWKHVNNRPTTNN